MTIRRSQAGPPGPACSVEENPVNQTNVNVPRNDDSSGMGAGMIIGLLIAIVIIGFIIWWFLLGGGGTPAETAAPSVPSLQSTVESIVESILPTGS